MTKKLERFGTMSSYGASIIVYLLLVVILPTNKLAVRNYHLSASAYHVLLLVVNVPLIATWVAAFYGYCRLRQYTNSIAKTAEASGYERLVLGFLWLAWSLVLPAFFSLISNAVTNNHAGLHPAATVIGNYLDLVFPLIAFTYISVGSNSLLTQARWNRIITQHLKGILALFAALAVMYCYVTFRYLNFSRPNDADNIYFLPTWILMLTIVIPYLYTWFVALVAAYEINTLARHAKGILYRQGLQLLAGGIVLVIASSIGAQYIRSTLPHPEHLTLSSVLITIYLFYIVTIAGFMLIGLGANRLKKIEDI